ncbi:hypothetical protein [uncultured Tateyamaria sp.]|uniref:hypothetical protein n=1 Tax=uncultured Tateyamaria sp. TaxID=455651 RepID=UPI00261274F7|nr:hypothetical protein [uncultured Tateyamaria sp.]
MGLAAAINEAPERHLDDLVSFLSSEFAIGTLDSESNFDKSDQGEVVSALKAWAYMHLNDGTQGD